MEIGRLVAVFDADVRKFDAGVKAVQSRLGGVTGEISKTTGQVGGLSGALNPANTGLSTFSSNLGAIAGISVVAATAIGGLIGGIFRLAQQTAKYAGGLQDLNDQTGIGVANLSALKLAFDQSGGSIESGATALSRYLRSVSDASTGNDKLRQKFLDIGFTVDDLNASYGNSDRAIEILVRRVGGMGNSQDRLNALQKVGVRNGQELNGAIIAMHGNLEEFRKEAERLGLVVTPEQAKAADDFDDSLQLLEKQIKGMSYSIAHQYIPEISGAIHDINGALAANQKGWAAWGDFIKTEIRGIRVAAAGLAGFIANINLGPGVAAVLGAVQAVQKSRQLHGEQFLKENVGASASVFDARPRGLGTGEEGRGGGGRGGRGGRDNTAHLLQQLADETLEGVTTNLQSEIEELQRSFERVGGSVEIFLQEWTVKENERHMVTIGHYKNEAEEASKIKNVIERQIALKKIENESQKEIRRHAEELYEIEDRRKELTTKILDDLFGQASQVDAMIRAFESVDLTRVAGAPMLGLADNAIAQLEQLQDIEPPDISQITRDILEMRQKLRDEMHILAGDITSVFDRALYDGISGGAKRGLQSLALGVLDIIRDLILGQLRNALANALSGSATGGGGFFSTLLRSIFGAAIGGAAGGVTSGGGGNAHADFAWTGRASGGPVSAMTPYMVGERGPELFVPHTAGNILNKQQMGGTTVININLPPTPPGSYKSPQSQRQLANTVLSALEGARR